jgi:TPP-dependent pyruvate/acetoin dehydrogenase alpha subunit
VLSEERVQVARKDAEDLMRAGIAAAEAEPPADHELVFTHAYVNPPENMRNG